MGEYAALGAIRIHLIEHQLLWGCAIDHMHTFSNAGCEATT